MPPPLRRLFGEEHAWVWFVWAALFTVLSLLRVVSPTDAVLLPLSGALVLLALTTALAPRPTGSALSSRVSWVGLALSAVIGASVYTVTRLGDAAWIAFSLTCTVWSLAIGCWLLLRRPKTGATESHRPPT